MNYGIVIIGEIPLNDVLALWKQWGEEGYTIIDAAISEKIGVNCVVTNEKGQKAWRKELGI